MGIGAVWSITETVAHELEQIKKRYEMERKTKKLISESEPIVQTKKHIDDMSYHQMIRLNRFAPIGHPYFTGEIGAYFTKVMAEKEVQLAPGQRLAISKDIGWEE